MIEGHTGGSAGLTGPDDSALARAAASGSRSALEMLITRHYDYVHAVCRRILPNPSDAEEARQEALYTVAARIRTFSGRSAFRTWVHRIAVNCSLDVLRKLRRTPEPVESLPEIPSGTGLAAGVVARLDVDAALAALPDAFREAVVLRDLCDLEYTEIADALGVPVGTVRSRIARGRQQLAASLGTSG